MKSSRRSCLESDTKKPRLNEDSIGINRISNDGSFIPQRAVNSGSVAPRFRAIDSWEDPENSDPLCEPYQPQHQSQHQQQHQQQQQLISEYKRALAELTINSKPIITNLTIIAGENMRDAKAIAAIICANILEVIFQSKCCSVYVY
ncbi:hypothetical protein EJD97_011106 [Solanum chilense]|uniref:CID domain-containing protein n=1 Tax=Solanum chilense TaxID=4083 RepID=A0A6N2BG34_SOLCI|nr:hypothetical protein EJD97_011106 [Solanum chilense]